MNPATQGMEGNASAPMLLYMTLELSSTIWRLALSDGATRRQIAVPTADLAKLAEAVAKAKERSGGNCNRLRRNPSMRRRRNDQRRDLHVGKHVSLAGPVSTLK